MSEGSLSPVEGRVVNFDHIIFWVSNAKTTSSYFVTRFGFKPLAEREASEENPVASYAVQLNQIKIVFESPASAENEIAEDILAHGDFVKDVAFEVQDLEELVRRARERGAELVTDVTEKSDDDGVIRYAVVRTYGDNTHTLVDRSKYNGIFWPGYNSSKPDPTSELLPEINLKYIDHVEGNMEDGTLESSLSWYERNLNMQRFWCVDYVDYNEKLMPYACINIGSVINQNETVLLSLNEASPAATCRRPSSKATDFIKWQGSPGVEHIALYTDDIIDTLRKLRTRGAEIVTYPHTYYTLVREKLQEANAPFDISETLDDLQEYGVLIDFDERGYMLQAFTKHLQVRPTIFLEVIQRKNHRGFGSANYKWVFEAIEMLDKFKDGNQQEDK